MKKEKTFLEEVLESNIIIDVNNKEFDWGEDVGLERWWENDVLDIIDEVVNEQNKEDKIKK